MLTHLDESTDTQLLDRLQQIDLDPTIQPDRFEQEFIEGMVWRSRRFRGLTRNQRRRAELIIERYLGC